MMKKHAIRWFAGLLAAVLLCTQAAAAVTPVTDATLALADSVRYTASAALLDTQEDLHENILEYRPEKAVRPVVAYGSTLYGTSAMDKTVKYLEDQGYAMVAAINGSFFDRTTGIPYGLVVTDGVLRTSGDGAAVGFYADGSAVIGAPGLEVDLISGSSRTPLHYNKTLTDSNGIILYSADYDYRTKNTVKAYHVVLRPVGEAKAQLRLGGSVDLEVIGMVEDTQSCAIPENGFLLAISEATIYQNALERMKALQMGERLSIEVVCSEQWKDVQYACAGGDLLLERGELCTTFTLDSADKTVARTAVGIRQDGSVIFYTVDEAGGSKGVKLSDLAGRMQALGCVSALNLDGGGSTAMGVTYPGYTSGSTANVPSDGKLRECANFIFLVRSKTAAGPAEKLFLYPWQGYVLPNAKLATAVRATDGSYMACELPGTVRYQAENAEVDQTGVFRVAANASGQVTLSASCGALTTQARYSVLTEVSSVSVVLEGEKTARRTLHVPGGSETKLQATAAYHGAAVYASDSSFRWSVSEELGTVDANGTFRAADVTKNVTGVLTASYGERTASVEVTVSPGQPFEDVKGHWAEQYINSLYFAGTLQGSTVGGKLYYRPNVTMTRQEFIVALMRYLGTDLTAYSAAPLAYADTDRIASWALDAVRAATSLGYLSGTSRGGVLYADPNGTITRQEAMTILSRTASFPEASTRVLDGFTDRASVASWAEKALAQMVDQKIIAGSNGRLNPSGNVTRGEVAKMLYLLAEKKR